MDTVRMFKGGIERVVKPRRVETFKEKGFVVSEENETELYNINISEMSKAELEAFADENGIDILHCKNNEERKSAITKKLSENQEV